MAKDRRDLQIIRQLIEQQNSELREEFLSLSSGGQYTEEQKQYAFRLLDQNGVRQTAIILDIPRRTIQRWCRDKGIDVNRCPDWVYERSARWHFKQRLKQLSGRIKADNDGVKLSPLKKGQSAIEDFEKRQNKQRSNKQATTYTKTGRSVERGQVLGIPVEDSAIDWELPDVNWDVDLSGWDIEELPGWDIDLEDLEWAAPEKGKKKGD
jgi:hypothetical protein